MDIKLLPSGSKSLIDANIFIYHLANVSPQCTSFLERIARREIEAFVTTIIIAEILHRRMLMEAVEEGLVTAGKVLNKLKENPEIIKKLNRHVAEVEKLLRLPMTIISNNSTHISQSHAFRQSHGLFVNDSINLASALSAGINNIVSHDDDFSRAPIALWQPTDI